MYSTNGHIHFIVIRTKINLDSTAQKCKHALRGVGVGGGAYEKARMTCEWLAVLSAGTGGGCVRIQSMAAVRLPPHIIRASSECSRLNPMSMSYVERKEGEGREREREERGERREKRGERRERRGRERRGREGERGKGGEREREREREEREERRDTSTERNRDRGKERERDRVKRRRKRSQGFTQGLLKWRLLLTNVTHYLLHMARVSLWYRRRDKGAVSTCRWLSAAISSAALAAGITPTMKLLQLALDNLHKHTNAYMTS